MNHYWKTASKDRLNRKILKQPHIYLITGLCLVIGLLSGCGKQNEPVSKSGFALNTFVTITIYDGASNADELLDECFALCDHYENEFSRTISGSDLSKLNSAGGVPVSVSNDLFEILKKGIYYGELSEGAFDIAIAPISSQWDFTAADPIVPNADAITAALPLVSYQNLVLDSTAHTACLLNSDAAIDLGGIAKGFIADRLKDYLISEGVTSAMIDLGGNILAVGHKPDGSNFTIGIKEPFSETGALSCGVSVADKSVVTSGTYQRYFTVDNVFYHHILDPRTGYPADTDLNSATIISDASVDGDALSTTCMLLGLDKGAALIEGLPDTEAIFITKDNVPHYTSGIEQYLMQ